MQKISEAKEQEIRLTLVKSLTGTRYESLLDYGIDEIVNLSIFIWDDDIDIIKLICKTGLDWLESSAERMRDYLPDLSEYYAGSEAEIEPEL